MQQFSEASRPHVPHLLTLNTTSSPQSISMRRTTRSPARASASQLKSSFHTDPALGPQSQPGSCQLISEQSTQEMPQDLDTDNDEFDAAVSKSIHSPNPDLAAYTDTL